MKNEGNAMSGNPEKSYTVQETFDYVVQQLRKQGKKAFNGVMAQCEYNGPDGTHCAIGWLLKDTLPTVFNADAVGNWIEPYTQDRFLDAFRSKPLLFWYELQGCHDRSGVDFLTGFEERITLFAERNALTVPAKEAPTDAAVPRSVGDILKAAKAFHTPENFTIGAFYKKRADGYDDSVNTLAEADCFCTNGAMGAVCKVPLRPTGIDFFTPLNDGTGGVPHWSKSQLLAQHYMNTAAEYLYGHPVYGVNDNRDLGYEACQKVFTLAIHWATVCRRIPPRVLRTLAKNKKGSLSDYLRE